MRWEFKEPACGDMIRVATGSIYHFGIYVSDDEVIQFGLAPSRCLSLKAEEIKVLSSDIDEFLAGGFLEVCVYDRKEKKKNRSPEEIVKYARSQIGRGGYNILYNNCEHFANECVNGTRVCNQAEDIRAFFRNMPIVDVYLAKLPDSNIGDDVACEERRKEIESVSNDTVKKEKYFVWKLLCYALERSFGMKENALSFTKNKHGAWSVDGAEISLSHSAGALAVAVSRDRVGIDIEIVHTPRSEKIAERIMNDKELAAFMALPDEEKDERFIEIWTRKEALFKSQKKDVFIPKDANADSYQLKSDVFTVDNKTYIWSVATPTPERVRVFKADIK